jgi:PKD repeat protein
MTKFFTLISFVAFITTFSFGQTPTAQFTATPLIVCIGELVTFTSSSTPNGTSPIVTYVWDFGDGSFGNGQIVTHSYSSSGNKNITLTIVNAAGFSDFEYKPNYITVKPTPEVNFSISGQGCTVPLTLTFNNQTAGAATYSWVFGNGQSSDLESPPSQNYTSAGTYNAILTATSSNGCVSSDTQEVVVSNYQTAISIPSVACVGQSVTFEDNSTAGANSWSWNFDGLGTSAEQNPTFTFTQSGTYTIFLSSQNTNSGCSGNGSQQITIDSTPEPSFSATPTSNCAPALINFTNTSPGGASYIWDFGDGQTFNGQNPVPHTYFLNGTYDVTLTMINSNGCSGITTLEDYIEITDVQAFFNSDVSGGCNPLTVNFSDSSITPSANNPIVLWNWDFGNGQTHIGQFPPAQTYTNGVYNVSLTVQTQSGCTGTITSENYITVGEINSISFSVDTIINCIKTDFEFSSNVVTTPIVTDSTELNYFWDFTDGTSEEPNPNYQFTSDTGFFDVQLVIDFRGCKDTMEIDSFVYINAPIAKFTPENTLYCNQGPNQLILFQDEATHGKPTDDLLMVWQWEYSDLVPSDTLDDAQLDDSDAGSMTHSYNGYGSYEIQQIIHNYTTGCSDSTTASVDISMVTPAFIMSNDSICDGDSLVLFDQSSSWSEHPLESWSFDMDNGSVVTGDTAYYVYNLPISNVVGNYDVALTVTNSVQCSATIPHPVTVLPKPFPLIGFNPATVCVGNFVAFTSTAFPVSGIPISSFEYFFSDDSTIVQTLPDDQISHTYNTNGVYFTDVKITDEFGCNVIQSVPITVIQPVSFFTVESVICNNDSVFTTNSSTGLDPLSFEWLIDASLYSYENEIDTILSESNPTVGNPSSGHTISLITTDGFGCKDTMTNTVTISIPWALPNYSFTGAELGPNGVYVCPPLFGTYADSSISIGQITTWAWDFGDGDVSSSQNPNNSYVLPGTYDLSLEVTDSYGCVSDTIFPQYVSIGGPSGEPDWNQQVGQCLQGALFTIVNPINVDSTFWVMGNNQTVSDSLNFFYNYSEPGTYTPGVYIFDDLGCDVFYPLDDITVLDDGIEAFFMASPNPVEPDEIITFIDGSTSASSSIIQWEWNYGNDTILFNSNASQQYSYSNSGVYPVTLTVTDAIGCQDSYSTIINIIINDQDLWLPNVITSNNDGLNELFVLPFDVFKNYTVTILNRWGNVMRIGDRDPANPLFLWDGTDQNGKICTDGVYFYRITGEMLGGTMVDKHGFVTVIESK